MERPTTFRLPNDSVRYLLWQRADYRSPLVKGLMAFLHKSGGGNTLKSIYMKHIAGSWLETMRRRSIADYYFSEMATIIATMRPHLPNTCERILDIGCGLGGIDALLFHEYHPDDKPVELWMLDKNDDSPLYGRHYVGFENVPAAYNSLEITRHFLESNGVPRSAIRLIDIGQDSFPRDHTFDVVVSLLAWGFHFPVDTYLRDVSHSLREGGTLFIDIRDNTDGIRKLESVFRDVDILAVGEKHRLAVARNRFRNHYD
jgi:SAM-dependent methyltransferase